jgi:hypothetical protein
MNNSETDISPPSLYRSSLPLSDRAKAGLDNFEVETESCSDPFQRQTLLNKIKSAEPVSVVRLKTKKRRQTPSLTIEESNPTVATVPASLGSQLNAIVVCDPEFESKNRSFLAEKLF